MDIKTFSIRRFDLDYYLTWYPETGYFIQAVEHGEWVESFSDIPFGEFPEERDDAKAIELAKLFVDHTKEELFEELENKEPVPDWEAQARYDEAHGTVNGYDPAVVQWREEFGGEYY